MSAKIHFFFGPPFSCFDISAFINRFVEIPSGRRSNMSLGKNCPRILRPIRGRSRWWWKPKQSRNGIGNGIFSDEENTWSIIPVSKWLGSPQFISHLGHLEREQPYLGDLLTMVIKHLLNGMILQVGRPTAHLRNGIITPLKTNMSP